MHLESQPNLTPFPLYADGFNGQEDELEDVHKGKLDPPTDDEGPGSLDEANDTGRTLESEDEDNAAADPAAADETEKRPWGERHPELP
jgi:hypothetical protein